MRVIQKPDWIRVEATLSDLATQKPEWFPQGFKGIHAVSNDNLFGAALDGRIYLSDADRLAPGFKPATALADAMRKIETGEYLAFTEEYAVETLWHEMLHGMTGIHAIRSPKVMDAVEEGLIQSVSRLSYDRLLSHWGRAAENRQAVIYRGLAYEQTARNFIELFLQAGLEPDWLFDLVTQNGDKWQASLGEALSRGLNIRERRIHTLFGHSVSKEISDFIQKIKVQQRNAPRSNQL